MHTESFFSSHSRPTLTGVFLIGLLLGMVGTASGAGMLGSGIFNDVPKNSYYDSAVGEMYERGVIKGYNINTFGPEDYVTRGQVAVMMQRLRNDLLSGGTITSTKPSSVSSTSSATSVYVNPRGTFQFTTALYSVREGSGDAALTVSRSNGSTGEITLQYAITAGSATLDTDFTGETGTIVFADKQTSKVITINVRNDALVENDETLTVRITDVGRAAIGTPATATVTIIDDDGASSSSAGNSTSSLASAASKTLSLAAATYSIREKDNMLTLNVERTGSLTGTVGVTYATGGGTADVGSDYTSTNGTLSFANGEAIKTISIPIIDNTSILGNKTFNITLSSPTGGASLGTHATSLVSIVDDDNSGILFGTGSFRFAKSSYTVDEQDHSVLITIQRISGAKGAANVTVTTANQTAMATLDYTALSTTLTFAPFESSKTVVIPIVEDVTNEEDEIFSLTLSNPTGGTDLQIPVATSITIID